MPSPVDGAPASRGTGVRMVPMPEPLSGFSSLSWQNSFESSPEAMKLQQAQQQAQAIAGGQAPAEPNGFKPASAAAGAPTQAVAPVPCRPGDKFAGSPSLSAVGAAMAAEMPELNDSTVAADGPQRQAKVQQSKLGEMQMQPTVLAGEKGFQETEEKSFQQVNETDLSVGTPRQTSGDSLNASNDSLFDAGGAALPTTPAGFAGFTTEDGSKPTTPKEISPNTANSLTIAQTPPQGGSASRNVSAASTVPPTPTAKVPAPNEGFKPTATTAGAKTSASGEPMNPLWAIAALAALGGNAQQKASVI